MRFINRTQCNQLAERLLQEMHLETEEDPQRAHLEQLIGLIVARAFQAFGIKWPVYVIFNRDKDNHSFNACTFNFYQKKKKASLVLISRPDLIDLHLIYAIAGHEAAHCLKEHGLVFATLFGAMLPLMTTSLWRSYKKGESLNFIAKILLTEIFFTAIAQLMEIDADVSMVDKLGSSSGLSLASYLASLPSPVLSFLSTHPSPQSRAWLLNKMSRLNNPSPITRSITQQLVRASFFSKTASQFYTSLPSKKTPTNHLDERAIHASHAARSLLNLKPS